MAWQYLAGVSMAGEISKPSRVAPGIVRAHSADRLADYGMQTWTEVKSRQHATCKVSGSAIQPGDMVYRPMTNKANRSWRVLALVMNAAVPDGVARLDGETLSPAATDGGAS